MKTPKAIPAVYNGVSMRSRLEAQTAALFDMLGWNWRYEPVSLMLPGGIHYIPDFFIPEHSMVVECRGYDTERGWKQLSAFTKMLMNADGGTINVASLEVKSFLLIAEAGPVICTTSSKELLHGILSKCDCGSWGVVLSVSRKCVLCNTYGAISRAAGISVVKGRVLLNGVHFSEVDYL